MAPLTSSLLLLLISALPHIWSQCSDGKLYVIRNQPSGLVLDASEPPQVKMQYFDGFSDQLWQIERSAHVGLFYIINNHTMTALEADVGQHTTVLAERNESSLYQRWFLNLNGTVVSAGLTGYYWNTVGLSAGDVLYLSLDEDTDEQKFLIQERVTIFEK